jgi:hypothetical protein
MRILETLDFSDFSRKVSIAEILPTIMSPLTLVPDMLLSTLALPHPTME